MNRPAMPALSASRVRILFASPVYRNALANLSGGAWAALVGLAMVPFYIRLMGIESYGIVGIFVSLQAMLSILDLGLSQTLTREMARLSIDRRNAPLMADTTRTLEAIYLCAAVLVALIVLALAEFISQEWLSPAQLSRNALREAVWAMSLVIGLRWPVSLYAGALVGLQRQIVLNALLAGFSTFQAIGALAVLWYIAPTIQAFFLWQGVVAVAQVVVLRSVLYKNIRAPRKGRFSRDIVIKLWRFAAGMTGIALVSILLTQTDKIILSKLLSLADFGYYVFATTVAGVLYAITSAVFAAYQPKLAEIAANEEVPRLTRIYHQGCQLMAVAIVPAAIVLCFFSREIITAWTHDSRIVDNAALLISLLVIGNLLHGLMHLPYALQLAFGWTRLALVSNAVAVVVLIPAIYWAATRWGSVGAAAVWIVLNLGYVGITMQLMHRRLLKNEKRFWYLDDVAKPIAVVVVVVGLARLLVSNALASPWIETFIAIVAVIAVGAAMLCAHALRRAEPATIQSE